MRTTGRATSFSLTGWFGRTALRIPLISSLLFVAVLLTALKNPKFRKWWNIHVLMPLYIKPCSGFCNTPGYHTHDLRIPGKWKFIWKYKALDAVIGDPRPQPPIDHDSGAVWFDDYEKAWKEAYPGYDNGSCWVRDMNSHWVWVTNTPQFDRNWFDGKGWQFPAAWITGPSMEFYKVGADDISTIVSLPPKEGGSSVPKDEVW